MSPIITTIAVFVFMAAILLWFIIGLRGGWFVKAGVMFQYLVTTPR